MTVEEELLEEDQETIAWYTLVNHPVYAGTIGRLASEGLARSASLALDPHLHLDSEFKNMTAERAMGIIQGRAQVWSEISQLKPKNDEAMEERKEAQIAGERTTEETGPEYKKQWYAEREG